MRLSLFTGRLWHHLDFLKLWGGQTISRIGSEITLLAVPTVAILLLHAGPIQVGVLGMLEYLAFPMLALVAGVYADRLRRRPIMIACDVGRALALASIPIAYLLNGLTLVQLYAVALAMGIFTVFFDVAYQSYLPALIDRADLVEGNTKLTISYSSARLIGPAVAGALIQLIGGARAVVLNSVSFLLSAFAIWRIRKAEPAPSPAATAGPRRFVGELKEGVGVVFGNSILWHIAGCTATANLGYHMIEPVFLIFAYRRLHLSPALVGVVLGIGSVGFLLSALVAGQIARVLGVGPALRRPSSSGRWAT